MIVTRTGHPLEYKYELGALPFESGKNMTYLNIDKSDVEAIIRLLSGDKPMTDEMKALVGYKDNYASKTHLGIYIAATYLDRLKLRYPFLSYAVEDEGIRAIRVFVPEEDEKVFDKIYDEIDELRDAIEDITFYCRDGDSLYMFITNPTYSDIDETTI